VPEWCIHLNPTNLRAILAPAEPIFLSNFLALFADIDQTGRNMEQI
jgi:hypothetical protein